MRLRTCSCTIEFRSIRTRIRITSLPRVVTKYEFNV